MERRSLRDQMNSTSELLARLKSDRSIADASLESADDRAHMRHGTHLRTPSRARTYSLSSQQSGSRNSFYLGRETASVAPLAPSHPPASQGHSHGHPGHSLELTCQRDAERQLLGAMQAAKHEMPGDLVLVLLQRVVSQTVGLYDGAEAGDIDALCVLLCDVLRVYQDDKAPAQAPAQAAAPPVGPPRVEFTPSRLARDREQMEGARSPDSSLRWDQRDLSDGLTRSNSRRRQSRIFSETHDELLSPLRTRESSWDVSGYRDLQQPRAHSRLASGQGQASAQAPPSPLLNSSQHASTHAPHTPARAPAHTAHAPAPTHAPAHTHAPRASSIPDASAKATRLKAVIDRLQRRPNEAK